MSETKLQAAILARLNIEPGAKFFRNSIDARGRYDRGLGTGSADLIGCYRGLFVAIEVKLPGKDAEPHQEKWGRELRAFANGIYLVAHSPEEAITEMKAECDEKRR